MRASVAAIDDLIASSTNSEGGRLQINSADLILLLQGHVYEDLACNSVVGTVSQASLAEIQHVVRSRILELTLALEKQIPAAAEITLGPASARTDDEEARTATQITNQVIHGNVTTISSIGDGAQIHVEVGERDTGTFCQALIDAGLPVGDARELAEIVNAEEAESADRPWGANAQAWLAKNIGKAASGTWKIGLKVATDVLTEAAMKFYGFK